MIYNYFDAFDEVDEQKREKLKKGIEYLADKCPDNIFVISSISLERNQDFIGWSRSSNFKMNKLTKQLAIELINNINYDINIKDKFLKELDEILYDQHE